jgi:hypothetical protein
MFPGIEPFLIGKHVAYVIGVYVLTVVGSQQIAPGRISVDIVYSCTTGKTGCSGGGIGIFLAT